MRKKLVDYTNGREVAACFVGIYRNTYGGMAEEFLLIMQSLPESIRYNFTVLGLKWIIDSADQGHDLRNREAFYLGKELETEFYDAIPEFDTYRKTPKSLKMEVDPTNDKDMAMLIGSFLSQPYIDYRGFVSGTYNEHRTIKQSTASFFMQWTKANLKSEMNVRITSLSRRMIKHERGLPFI